MFQIGEFSRISRVTIDTLRHYDAINLLKPVKVDPSTGYRYYATHQLQTLNQIIALKEIGFSLDEIGRLLQASPSVEEMRDMLNTQLASATSRLEAAQLQQARIMSHLKRLDEGETIPTFDITLKTSDGWTVVAMRETIATAKEVPQHWQRMFSTIAAYASSHHLATGPAMTFYHNDSFVSANIDTECALVLRRTPTDDVPKPTSPMFIRQVAAESQLATTFVADYRVEGLEPAYRMLGQWIGGHGFHISGAPRELYHGSPAEGDFSAEIQIPVTKGEKSI